MTTGAPTVVIDARMFTGTLGGIETMLIGLADGLAEIGDTGVAIAFVGYEGHTDWLEPHLSPQTTLLRVPPPIRAPDHVKRHLGYLLGLVRRGRDVITGANSRIPRDTAIEQLHADLVHFPHQGPGQISAPFIYQPHDLQHRHLPQFFTSAQLRRREAYYGPLCRAAARVVVGTSWVKDDVVEQYSVAPEKVTVIPLAPVTALASAGEALAWLPADYLLYPAAFWPHKNHARLLEALRLVRESHADAHLVLTGASVEAGTDVAAHAAALGLADYVHIAGFLSETDLATAYSHARLVVVPTLFEAASFPIWEAFSRGVPVACSTVTALPRQVADAAVLFDPLDIDEIAAAIAQVWSDPELRATLVARGAARVAEFSWADTARRFVALYRVLTGVETPQDVALLAEEPKL